MEDAVGVSKTLVTMGGIDEYITISSCNCIAEDKTVESAEKIARLYNKGEMFDSVVFYDDFLIVASHELFKTYGDIIKHVDCTLPEFCKKYNIPTD